MPTISGAFGRGVLGNEPVSPMAGGCPPGRLKRARVKITYVRLGVYWTPPGKLGVKITAK